MPVPAFAITSSRVVTPEGVRAAAVVIKNEKISAVVAPADVPQGIRVVDVGERVISPGVVDGHVHVNEPGRTQWEGFLTATSAAAAGGVTTIIDMPLNSSPVTTSVDALNVKRAAANNKCHVDVGFHGGLVPGNGTEIQPLVDAGVVGMKAFLCDSGLDEFPASGEAELRSALEILRVSGVPLLAHAEIVDEDLQPKTSDHRSYQQYIDSRPESFELVAIEMLIELCREFESPVHIVHLATATAIAMIEAAKDAGLPLTVETCPHYIQFSSEQIQDGQTQFKCAPPIRDEANRVALCNAVVQGQIDLIGSDHSPCPPELKLLSAGDFSKAWGGVAGLQLTLPATWSNLKDAGMTLEALAQRLSSRPAEMLGLGNRKGKIAVGFDADLVVWNPEESVRVDGARLFHRHDVTPYDGVELFGAVKTTYVRGHCVFDCGELVSEQPLGKRISRHDPAAAVAGFINTAQQETKQRLFESCCASGRWIEQMLAGGKFSSDQDVIRRAQTCWQKLGESDWLEAFSAHPVIGDVNSLREKYANTKAIASGEQAGVDSANEQTLMRLAQANAEYLDKFGFIFIVYATGKSANEMLQILEQRLVNDRETELKNAAAEQLKITKTRLKKLTPPMKQKMGQKT